MLLSESGEIPDQNHNSDPATFFPLSLILGWLFGSQPLLLLSGVCQWYFLRPLFPAHPAQSSTVKPVESNTQAHEQGERQIELRSPSTSTTQQRQDPLTLLAPPFTSRRTSLQESASHPLQHHTPTMAGGKEPSPKVAKRKGGARARKAAKAAEAAALAAGVDGITLTEKGKGGGGGGGGGGGEGDDGPQARNAAGVLASEARARDIKIQSFSLSFHSKILVEDSTIEMNYGRRCGSGGTGWDVE